MRASVSLRSQLSRSDSVPDADRHLRWKVSGCEQRQGLHRPPPASSARRGQTIISGAVEVLLDPRRNVGVRLFLQFAVSQSDNQLGPT